MGAKAEYASYFLKSSSITWVTSIWTAGLLSVAIECRLLVAVDVFSEWNRVRLNLEGRNTRSTWWRRYEEEIELSSKASPLALHMRKLQFVKLLYTFRDFTWVDHSLNQMPSHNVLWMFLLLYLYFSASWTRLHALVPQVSQVTIS